MKIIKIQKSNMEGEAWRLDDYDIICRLDDGFVTFPGVPDIEGNPRTTYSDAYVFLCRKTKGQVAQR